MLSKACQRGGSDPCQDCLVDLTTKVQFSFQKRKTLYSTRKKLGRRFKRGSRRKARAGNGEDFPVAREELYVNYAIAAQQLNEMFETDYVSWLFLIIVSFLLKFCHRRVLSFHPHPGLSLSRNKRLLLLRGFLPLH